MISVFRSTKNVFPIALIVYKASGIPRGTEGRTGTPKGGGIWADETKKREEKTMKELKKDAIIIACVTLIGFMVLPFISIISVLLTV